MASAPSPLAPALANEGPRYYLDAAEKMKRLDRWGGIYKGDELLYITMLFKAIAAQAPHFYNFITSSTYPAPPAQSVGVWQSIANAHPWSWPHFLAWANISQDPLFKPSVMTCPAGYHMLDKGTRSQRCVLSSVPATTPPATPPAMPPVVGKTEETSVWPWVLGFAFVSWGMWIWTKGGKKRKRKK